jgi:hypothetical protein
MAVLVTKHLCLICLGLKNSLKPKLKMEAAHRTTLRHIPEDLKFTFTAVVTYLPTTLAFLWVYIKIEFTRNLKNKFKKF